MILQSYNSNNVHAMIVRFTSMCSYQTDFCILKKMNLDRVIQILKKSSPWLPMPVTPGKEPSYPIMITLVAKYIGY